MTTGQYTLELRGCAPVPLAHYLKALGILRLVAEQADPDACGWWMHDTFHLRSTLGRESLLHFLRADYCPTPLVGPWGARSGFFPGSSEKTAREALDCILASTSPRFAQFQLAINAVRRVLDLLGLQTKAETDDEKLRLLRACRSHLNDDCLKWLDAVYVLLNDGRSFPPLLGTGGNEGSGSYMSGFAQQVVAVLEDRAWDHALETAIFGDISPSVGDKQTPGHFLPDAAGGSNAGSGFEGAIGTNPWDYILALEGTLLFGSSAAKRLEDHGDGSLAYPFCVRPVGVGYPSADLSDEAPARAEMWFPIWERPTSRSEIATLLNEGRATVGRRKARNGVDFARAVAGLGVDRGVSRFERFGFQQRNGLSYFAIPLGTFQATATDSAAVALLDPLDSWLDRFRRAATGKTAPARAGRALRRLERAILDLCQQDRAENVQAVLIALGEAEATVAISKKLRDGEMGGSVNPLPPLSPDWLVKANDHSREFRLAAALASVTHQKVGPIRRHLEPIDTATIKSRLPKWSKQADDPGIVWGSGDLVRNLNAVLSRRLVEVLQTGKEDSDVVLLAPLHGRCWASLGDIAAFIDGEVDDQRIDSLLRGLMLLDWSKVEKEHRDELRGRRFPPPDAAYAMLKLCHLPHRLDDLAIRLDPQIARRAMGGNGAEATRLAARRLHASGIPPAVAVANRVGDRARRIAAAIMFPLSKHSAGTLLDLVERRDKRPEEDREPTVFGAFDSLHE